MSDPIIDTHIHFWDLKHPDLKYVWLEPEFVHPILGDIDAMKSQRYDIQSLWAEARFADIEAFVHVQAAIGSADPVDETRWLAEMQKAAPAPFTIVGHVDLGSPDARCQLDGHGEVATFVGVRDFATEGYFAAHEIPKAFEDSLTDMAERGLVFDIDCEWQNMGEARALAERHPGLTVVLEHIGFPRSRDDAYFEGWAAAIRDLALAPNVVCKISGVGMTDPRGVGSDFARWIDTCIDAFGPGRCVVGSNWPLDRLVSSYDAIMAVYRAAAESLSPSERAAFLAGNARRIYGLDKVVPA